MAGRRRPRRGRVGRAVGLWLRRTTAPLRRRADLPRAVRAAVLRRATARRHSASSIRWRPIYNTLLRVDPTDRPAPSLRRRLAESWTVSKDGLDLHVQAPQGRQVPRRQRDDLEGRQGVATTRSSSRRRRRESTARASTRSSRSVEAPDPYTVRFRLKWPAASFLASLASPWNWIYKADILAEGPALVRDPHHGHRARSSSSST